MRNKMSIKPILRKDKERADGKMPLNILAIINGKTYKRGTNEFICPNYWDNENRIVKKGMERASLINNRIKCEIAELEGYLMKVEISKGVLSTDDIRKYYQKEEKVYLYDFWETQMEGSKKKLRTTTIKNYSCTFNRLKEFCPISPLIADVDYKFIKGFDSYLRDKRNNELSGANTRHKCLKAILREAKRSDFIEKIPYDNFKLKKTEGRKVFLTSEEIHELINLELPPLKKNLSEVRDMFIFACYTGLRISDVTNLKWVNITENKIEIEVVKTKKALTTGLINITKSIIGKYRNNNAENVFPIKSHQKINKNLKALIKIAGINKDVSFHCARHSFTSLLIKNNVHLTTIKNLLGHEDINDTMNYAHCLEEDKISALQVLEK